MASGIVNTVLDFVVVSIPIPVVWRLKMNMRLRLSIIFLFAVGFLICFAGVIRTVYTYYLTTDYDRTWNGYVVYLTGSIEIFVGIVGLNPVIQIYLTSLTNIRHALLSRRLSPSSCVTSQISYPLSAEVTRPAIHRPPQRERAMTV